MAALVVLGPEAQREEVARRLAAPAGPVVDESRSGHYLGIHASVGHPVGRLA